MPEKLVTAIVWTVGFVLAAAGCEKGGSTIETAPDPLCAAGQYNCKGDLLQVCNAARTGWDDLMTCAPSTCVQGSGQCDPVAGTGGSGGGSAGSGGTGLPTGGSGGTSETGGTGGTDTGGTGGTETGGAGGTDAGGTGGTTGCGSLTDCNGSCVDLATDPDNCGECGIDVTQHEDCWQGIPVAKMVQLPAGFSIDSTEVTQGQYEAWLGTGPQTSSQPGVCTPWNTSYQPSCEWFPATKPNRPVVCVDWCDASAYCAGVGKRLCGKIGGGSTDGSEYADQSKNQWYHACSSAGQNDYVYGDTFQPTTCWGTASSGGELHDVATSPSCQSQAAGYEGVFDLTGNAYEWEDGTDDGLATSRLRGGGADADETQLKCVSYASRALDTQHNLFGFRCCSAP
jgi:hypothetical protein